MKRDYLYGAYGSNLNAQQMRVRCPDAQMVGKMKLKGWRLVFKGVADIVPDRDAEVEIGLWSITDRCELALDRYEGYPSLYTKLWIPSEHGEVMLYTMSDGYSVRPPIDTYLQTIAQGYFAFGLDNECLKEALKASYVDEGLSL